jgi:hypothetical protein
LINDRGLVFRIEEAMGWNWQPPEKLTELQDGAAMRSVRQTAGRMLRHDFHSDPSEGAAGAPRRYSKDTLDVYVP